MKSRTRNILIGVVVVLVIVSIVGSMWWKDVSVAALPQTDVAESVLTLTP